MVILLSCVKQDCAIQDIINKLRSNDKHLDVPQPGEWLYEHHEKGQTFKAYLSCSPVTPTSEKKLIYLQPIGSFDTMQLNLIKFTKEYLEAFYNLEINILDVISNDVIPDSVKRIKDGNEQVLASYILNGILREKLPNDAIALMAITELDLYPNPSWNFVFGLASYKNKVGVTSLFRLCDHELNSSNYTSGLSRVIKILSHEIGHMFSLHHCTNAVCLMNGSNSLRETDNTPNRLCSECTGKIIWNLKMDTKERLIKLQEFFSKHQMHKDMTLINNDLRILESI